MATREPIPGPFSARNNKPTPSGALKTLLGFPLVENTSYNPALKLRDPISIAIRITSISGWGGMYISKFLLC